MSDGLDIITLRGLTARGHHGVFPFEREGSQPFSADVSLWVDTRAAAADDDIELTVSYADIAAEAVAVLEGPSVHLLETLAQRVAEAALAHPLVRGVEVTIHKPMAPLRQQFSDVAVTIRRGAAVRATGDGGVPADEGAPASLPGAVPAAPGSGLAAPAHTVPAPVEGGTAVPAVPAVPGRRVAQAGAGSTGHEGWSHVVLALGGNIADVPVTLAAAVESLVDLDGLEVDEVSPLVRTAPVLDADQAPQDDYWNAVVLARTGLSPQDLLAATRRIEDAHGRVRHEHWGARTLDIDLIQYEGARVETPDLTLPHPRARSRAFVLVPWQLADPDAVLAGAGRVDVLARAASDRAGIRDAVSDWLEDPASVGAESDEVLRTGAEAAPPVLATPAGGSVVVSAPTPSTRPSRLDALPESTRAGLRPSESGGDYLWRTLWEQWQHTGPFEGTDVPVADTAPVGTGVHTATPPPGGDRGPLEGTPVDGVRVGRRPVDARPAGTRPVAPPEGHPAAPSPHGDGSARPRHGAPAPAGAVHPAVASSHVTATRPPSPTAPPSGPGVVAAPVGPVTPVRPTGAEPAAAPAEATHGRGTSAPGTSGPGMPAPGTSAPGTTPSGPARTAPEAAQAAADAGGQAPRRRHGARWVPVRAAADQTRPVAGAATSGARPAAQGARPTATGARPTGGTAPTVPPAPASRESGRTGQVHPTRAASPSLPAWNFPSRDGVRIVDDARDLSPEPGAEPAPQAGAGAQDPEPARGPHDVDAAAAGPQGQQGVRRRSVLDAHVPEGAPTGPIDHDPATQTSVMRRVTVRPTVTGQLPVGRRGAGDQR